MATIHNKLFVTIVRSVCTQCGYDLFAAIPVPVPDIFARAQIVYPLFGIGTKQKGGIRTILARPGLWILFFIKMLYRYHSR